MNPGASVSSIAALSEWHASLTNFRTEAQNALTSLTLALQQADVWLDEQEHFWRRQIRHAEDEVTRAKNELATREYTRYDDSPIDTTVQEENLRLAQARLRFCEDRLDQVRRWRQRLPVAIREVYEGPTRSLAFFLDSELPRGLALLVRQLNALEQYANVRPAHVGTARESSPQATPSADASKGKEQP